MNGYEHNAKKERLNFLKHWRAFLVYFLKSMFR